MLKIILGAVLIAALLETISCDSLGSMGVPPPLRKRSSVSTLQSLPFQDGFTQYFCSNFGGEPLKCVEPRECISGDVGNERKLCTESDTSCSCIPPQYQECSSSSECMQGELCYGPGTAPFVCRSERLYNEIKSRFDNFWVAIEDFENSIAKQCESTSFQFPGFTNILICSADSESSIPCPEGGSCVSAGTKGFDCCSDGDPLCVCYRLKPNMCTSHTDCKQGCELCFSPIHAPPFCASIPLVYANIPTSYRLLPPLDARPQFDEEVCLHDRSDNEKREDPESSQHPSPTGGPIPEETLTTTPTTTPTESPVSADTPTTIASPSLSNDPVSTDIHGTTDIPVPTDASATSSPSTSVASEATSLLPTSDPVCIDVNHLNGYEMKDLVFSTHRRASVFCDSNRSCATEQHIVTYKGKPMTMKSYCQLTKCSTKVAWVNSPVYRFGTRVPSNTKDLFYSALAAPYNTRLEEAALSAMVRVGF